MKLSIFILGIIISINVGASEFCYQLYDFSSKVMQMRQQNTPIIEQMRIVERMRKANPQNKPVHDLFSKVIATAYKEPRYELKENQEKSMKDFANEWAALCYAKEQ